MQLLVQKNIILLCVIILFNMRIFCFCKKSVNFMLLPLFKNKSANLLFEKLEGIIVSHGMKLVDVGLPGRTVFGDTPFPCGDYNASTLSHVLSDGIPLQCRRHIIQHDEALRLLEKPSQFALQVPVRHGCNIFSGHPCHPCDVGPLPRLLPGRN